MVSGFGSVYIDGIEFTTADAEIRFNGGPATESDLRIGDTVTVSGTIENGRGQAERIVFDRQVDGPIADLSKSADCGSFTALEQPVRFDGETSFINTDADVLENGDLVAISGGIDSNGVLRATSIERGTADGNPIDYQAGNT